MLKSVREFPTLSTGDMFQDAHWMPEVQNIPKPIHTMFFPNYT